MVSPVRAGLSKGGNGYNRLMLSRLELLIDLLHSASDAALATHSTTLDGFPFSSAVPLVVDEQHRPIFLISGLAEHTRNLIANPKASLMVAKQLGEGEMARVSLIGEIHPVEVDPLFVKRYLRYQPHAERFLQLGDFRFHRLDPIRILTVGGFAKASWLDGERLRDAHQVSLAKESKLIEQVAPTLVAGFNVLGIDSYGADVQVSDVRHRIRFATGPVADDAMLPTLVRETRALATRAVSPNES
jgi:hypothetical protein